PPPLAAPVYRRNADTGRCGTRRASGQPSAASGVRHHASGPCEGPHRAAHGAGPHGDNAWPAFFSLGFLRHEPYADYRRLVLTSSTSPATLRLTVFTLRANERTRHHALPECDRAHYRRIRRTG